jgi:hypothetical protein
MNQHLNHVGETAGKVWHFLKQNGKTNLTELEGEIDAPRIQTYLALGWLAREGKLNLTQEKKTTQISLTE